jgi:hypothetical protein
METTDGNEDGSCPNLTPPIYYFYVAMTVTGHLHIGGPFDTELEAIQCDKDHVNKYGPEYYVERHTCPTIDKNFKQIVLKQWAHTKRREKELERRGDE